MKSFVKNLGYRIISGSSLPRTLHKWIARNALTIIAYHAVIDTPLTVYDWCFLDEFSFREQIKYLKTHFNVVHLSEAIELIENGDIDRPTAVVTFDDGFQNNYDVAFPILHQYGIPATIFLTTKYIDTDDTIWFCKLNHALIKTRETRLSWNGSLFNIAHSSEKAYTSALIQLRLKEMSHEDILKQVREIIMQTSDDPDYPISPDSPYRILSSDAITKMVESGLFEFGAHTDSHAILSNLSSREKEEEIARSVRQVEGFTQKPCKLFAYPNGGEKDFDKESIDLLNSHGIRAALTMIPGPNVISTPLMQLRRYGLAGNIELAEFQVKIHHFIWACKRAMRIKNSVS